jgi:hypothetical protein
MLPGKAIEARPGTVYDTADRRDNVKVRKVRLATHHWGIAKQSGDPGGHEGHGSFGLAYITRG